jgi:hypothetical protein
MISGKYLAPALIFFAGAVLGRVFGLKPLVRGAMTVASMAGVADVPRREPPQHPRRIAHQPARRRTTRKRTRAA